MKYIIIDLEWNGAGTHDGFFDEIIEIGAVALDDSMSVTGEFQEFVAPKQTKKLRGRIKELTHITNDDLKNADGFVKVFDKFKAWIGADQDNCMLSWGNSDISVLYENLNRYKMLDEIYVIKNYCDAQLLCQKAADVPLTKQVGLSAFAELIGVEIGEDQLHRAINDSRLTARCLAKMFKPELFSEFAKKADKIFYERMNFKCYHLQDINDEQVNFSGFMTQCPACGSFMKRITRFTYKNKKHYALYRCGLCGRKFNISHALRITYDGLEHKKALHLIGSTGTEGSCESAGTSETASPVRTSNETAFAADAE
jgi:DNA polymerase III, epsilon subunit and related 3''-5'' exonucleases